MKKEYDINIEKGTDFSLSFAILDNEGALVDLTGAAVTAQLREYPEGSEAIDFTCSHSGQAGMVTIALAHETTAGIGYAYGRYDVIIEYPNDGPTENVLHGKAFIYSTVTRPLDGTLMPILSFTSFDSFPAVGNPARIYMDLSNSFMYRWIGTQYIAMGNLPNSIASIEKTGTSGLVDTYTITYTNGDTDTFEVTNGADGQDGQDGRDGADGQDGQDGAAATIAVGTVSTLEPGSDATVANVGTSSAAVFNFGIPKGAKGDTGSAGSPGSAATVAVGTVTTLPAGSSATVTNSGTSSAAVFDFGIPKGDPGSGASVDWGDIEGTLADQTDLKNALDAKADADDLGDLAALDTIDYTGNYLTNKPTLGGIQIRPDYIISDTDLTDGTSPLNSGVLYFYYEA